jgi:serine/threonine-protein kinase ULK4
MNEYHIYEEIGRGKGTCVYKGRKKQTVEYVAIKSVDRTLKAKILHEVRFVVCSV